MLALTPPFGLFPQFGTFFVLTASLIELTKFFNFLKFPKMLFQQIIVLKNYLHEKMLWAQFFLVEINFWYFWKFFKLKFSFLITFNLILVQSWHRLIFGVQLVPHIDFVLVKWTNCTGLECSEYLVQNVTKRGICKEGGHFYTALRQYKWS